MPRYRLDIEYDGGPYAGWQRQAAGQHTVQAAIEQAIALFCGDAISLRGAGRTDAGVHATARWLMPTCPKPGRTTRCAMPSTPTFNGRVSASPS